MLIPFRHCSATLYEDGLQRHQQFVGSETASRALKVQLVVHFQEWLLEKKSVCFHSDGLSSSATEASCIWMAWPLMYLQGPCLLGSQNLSFCRCLRHTSGILEAPGSHQPAASVNGLQYFRSFLRQVRGAAVLWQPENMTENDERGI